MKKNENVHSSSKVRAATFLSAYRRGIFPMEGLNEEAPTIFKVMLRGTIRNDDF